MHTKHDPETSQDNPWGLPSLRRLPGLGSRCPWCVPLLSVDTFSPWRTSPQSASCRGCTAAMVLPVPPSLARRQRPRCSYALSSCPRPPRSRAAKRAPTLSPHTFERPLGRLLPQTSVWHFCHERNLKSIKEK